MSVTSPVIIASNKIVASPPANGLTGVCSVDGVSTPNAVSPVLLHGSVNLTVGTAGTSVQLKLFHGNPLAGAAIATGAAVTTVAGNLLVVSIDAIDNPGEVAGLSYTLAVTVANASAQSTVSLAFLRAEY